MTIRARISELYFGLSPSRNAKKSALYQHRERQRLKLSQEIQMRLKDVDPELIKILGREEVCRLICNSVQEKDAKATCSVICSVNLHMYEVDPQRDDFDFNMNTKTE